MTPADLFQYRQLRQQGLSHDEIQDQILSMSEKRSDLSYQRSVAMVGATPQEELEKCRHGVEVLTKECKKLEAVLKEKLLVQADMIRTKQSLQAKLRERQWLLCQTSAHHKSPQEGFYAWGENASKQIGKES